MIIRKLTPCLGTMSGIHIAVHVTHKATSKLIKTLIFKLISQSVLRCKMAVHETQVPETRSPPHGPSAAPAPNCGKRCRCGGGRMVV